MSVQELNVILTAILSVAIIAGIVVYFLLLQRTIRGLQRTIMLEIERLRITLSQSRPSGVEGDGISHEALADAVGRAVAHHLAPIQDGLRTAQDLEPDIEHPGPPPQHED